MTRNNMGIFDQGTMIDFDDWDNRSGHLGFEIVDDGVEVDFYDNIQDSDSAAFTLSKKEVLALQAFFNRAAVSLETYDDE